MVVSGSVQLAWVRAKRASRCAHAAGGQQRVPGGLVLRSRSGQFVDVNDFADIVAGGAIADGVAVEPQGRVPGGEPGSQLPGDVVDGAQVRGQAGGCPQRRQQRADLGGQRS